MLCVLMVAAPFADALLYNEEVRGYTYGDTCWFLLIY